MATRRSYVWSAVTTKTRIGTLPRPAGNIKNEKCLSECRRHGRLLVRETAGAGLNLVEAITTAEVSETSLCACQMGDFSSSVSHHLLADDNDNCSFFSLLLPLFSVDVVKKVCREFTCYCLLPLSACLPACLSVSASLCLPACLSVSASLCLPACLSVSASLCLPACLSVSVCLSVCLSL